MKRRLSRIFVSVSFLLFCASVAVWLRSQSFADGFLYETVIPSPDGSSTKFVRGLGHRASTVYFFYTVERDPPNMLPQKLRSSGFRGWSERVEYSPWDSGFNPRIVRWHFKNLGWVDETLTRGNWIRSRFLAVPIWLFAVIFGIAPVLWVIQHYRHRVDPRRLADHCKTCGYDLRASIEKCSECGTPFDKPAVVPVHP